MKKLPPPLELRFLALLVVGLSILSTPVFAVTHDASPDDVWASSDIVAYYRLDEAAGSTVEDSAGSNDGTIINPSGIEYAHPALLPQSWGSALGLDANGYVDLGSSSFDYIHLKPANSA